MLMRMFFQVQVVAAEVMVMPRSCSCSIQSMVAVPFVHFADTVRDARIEQNALGRRRFSGVDVRHDPDVPATIQTV